MRLLIHGDNLSQSREYLHQSTSQFKSKGFEIVTLDGKRTDANAIIVSTESQSLFGDKKLVVLERLFSHPSSTTRKTILSHLNSLQGDSIAMIIWEPKLLYPSQFKALSSFTPKVYKTPPTVFIFLDSLTPGSQSWQELLHTSLDHVSPEFVLYMIASRIRDLATVESNKKLAKWQKARLSTQASQWSQEQLISLHDNITQLDANLKTGAMIMPLRDELELLLATTLA